MVDPFHLQLESRGRTRQVRQPQPGTDIDEYSPGTSWSTLRALANHRLGWTVYLLMGLIFVMLVGRLVQLQVVRGQEFRQRSDQNRVRTVTTPAPRGLITDRFGTALAENVPNIIVTVTPADLPADPARRQMTIDHIASTINLSSGDITTALKNDVRRTTDPVSIREHIPYTQAMSYVVALADVPSVAVVSLPNRHYPLAQSAATVVGYTGRISPAELSQQPTADPLDIVGKTGLEKTYDQILTGRDGERQVERDVQNREQRVLAMRDPEPGQTVVTTIDAALQQQLAKQLQQAVSKLHTTGGAAIAVNPQNGEILAMTSAPSFDNNWFVEAGHDQAITQTLSNPHTPLLNRAISGQYPSGSIIKPLLASAALTEHTITPTSTVLSVGGFKVGNDFFPDWKAGGHGVTNVIKALAESVNTFFYAVGGGYDTITGLGVDRIVKYLQLFGWGQKLGVDLPAEAGGFLPTKDWRTNDRPSPWKLGDTYHLSIGQGDIAVTPLQVLTAFSAVANGGRLITPHVTLGIWAPDGTTKSSTKAKILNPTVVPASVLNVVRSGLLQGVLTGSSRALQSLPVTSGAKTGTAQFGKSGQTHAWFAAFAPYDQPRIAIVVIIEAGGEGNATALPVAKNTLAWYFTQGSGKTVK